MNISSQLKKYKLTDYNTINIVYKIKTSKDLDNILIQLKTLFGFNFSLLDVTKKVDKKKNIVFVKHNKVQTTLNNKLTGITNIFHTYEDNDFISYQKYNHSIIDIINPLNDTTNTLNNKNYIITIENNEIIPICESYNMYGTRYLEYNFDLENNIKIKCEYYLDSYLYKLVVNIPIMEEKYITDDKLKYINEICDKINTIMNE